MTLMFYSCCAVKVDFHCHVTFYVRAHVNLARLNKIEAMYKVSLKGKVERGSTFTFTGDLPYIPFFYLFT